MRVVIGDDFQLFRDGLTSLLSLAGQEVVGSGGDAASVVAAVVATRPDVAVLDVRMPPTFTREGLDAAAAIRAQVPGTAVLVLSQYIEAHWAVALLGEGAGRTGYLLKERVRDVGALVAAMEQLCAGGTVVDPEVVAALLGSRTAEDPLAALTAREREVLGRMAEGRSNQAIAEAMHLSEKTVDSHVRSLLQKLDIYGTADDNRRVLAVLAFLRGTRLTS